MSSVTTLSSSIDGHTTVQLVLDLDDGKANVYAMAGTAETTMVFPPAFQVGAPFGVDIGGVNPAFVAVVAEAEYDSWLTVGVIDGSAGSAIAASPGLGLDGWTEDAAFSTNNGAVFWMSPSDGPSGRGIVMAQITSAAGRGRATADVQGKSSRGGDWTAAVQWAW